MQRRPPPPRKASKHYRAAHSTVCSKRLLGVTMSPSSMNTVENHRNYARLAAAVAGAGSAVMLAYLGVVSSQPESAGVVTGAGPAAMSTGATTSTSAAPTTMAVPVATPSRKATPFWGQPSEP